LRLFLLLYWLFSLFWRCLLLLLLKTFNLLLGCKQSVDLELIHIVFRYLISLSERLTFLLDLCQAYSPIFAYLFDLSCYPSRLHWNKLLLIKLYNLKTNFVVNLTNIVITELLPSLYLLFINTYPLVFFVLIEIFLYYFITKCRRKFYINFWLYISNHSRRC
jgi:hypothetical protein